MNRNNNSNNNNNQFVTKGEFDRRIQSIMTILYGAIEERRKDCVGDFSSFNDKLKELDSYAAKTFKIGFTSALRIERIERFLSGKGSHAINGQPLPEFAPAVVTPYLLRRYDEYQEAVRRGLPTNQFWYFVGTGTGGVTTGIFSGTATTGSGGAGSSTSGGQAGPSTSGSGNVNPRRRRVDHRGRAVGEPHAKRQKQLPSIAEEDDEDMEE